jgi:hypothetical protein
MSSDFSSSTFQPLFALKIKVDECCSFLGSRNTLLIGAGHRHGSSPLGRFWLQLFAFNLNPVLLIGLQSFAFKV